MSFIKPRLAKWSESPCDRDTFLDLFEAFYGVLPENHLEAICSVHQDDRLQVSRWCRDVVPMKSRDMLGFPRIDYFRASREITDAQVVEWLHERGVSYQNKAYVFLNDQYERVLVMPWKLVLRYWEALERHSGYALLVTDIEGRWAWLSQDGEYFQFGSYQL